MNLEQTNIILKHVFSEPRHRAIIEWHLQFPDPITQIINDIGRLEAERYIVTGQWSPGIAEKEVSVVMYEQPDWDWWEPTSEWRRINAREAEFNAKYPELK